MQLGDGRDRRSRRDGRDDAADATRQREKIMSTSCASPRIPWSSECSRRKCSLLHFAWHNKDTWRRQGILLVFRCPRFGALRLRPMTRGSTAGVVAAGDLKARPRGGITRDLKIIFINTSQQRAGGIAMGHARGRGMGCMDELPC